MTQQTNLPVAGVLVGLTHNADLSPIIREPRVLRVGIGVPRGRASYIYTHGGRWIIRYGAWKKEKLVMETAQGSDGKPGFPNRKEAEEYYLKNKNDFAVSDRPQKIPFFTFTRRTIIETKGKIEEVFEPDFNAIEAHGDTPREIDIVFMGDNPLFGEYQAWSASELKCHGDGLNALRVVSLGDDKWPGWKQAVEAKSKYFSVSECWVSGLCPFMQEGGFNRLVCKPSSTLTFQLANSIRLGATAYFSTTSIRSTRNLFSSLEIIRSIAERAGASIANTPMKLVLAPFRTNHNGIAATQYGVSLELRAQDASRLREMLSEAAWKPAPPRMITATEDDVPQVSAATVTAEFYPEAEFDDEDGVTQGSSAQVATEVKAEKLAEKITVKASGDNGVGAGSNPQPGTVIMQPSSVPDPRDANWQQRVTRDFLVPLGGAEFAAVLHAVTGSDDLVSVTFANHKAVWDAMTKAKDRADSKVEPPLMKEAVMAPAIEDKPKDGELF